MPITVPKPITNPAPFSVTHTPYDPSGMLTAGSSVPAWASIVQAKAQQLPQIGTITGITAPPPKAAPTPGVYKPADPTNVNAYLRSLQRGWSVDTKTGQMISPGMKGGSSLQSYAAHQGILDPVSAQAAVQQFQKGGGVANSTGPGPSTATGMGPPAVSPESLNAMRAQQAMSWYQSGGGSDPNIAWMARNSNPGLLQALNSAGSSFNPYASVPPITSFQQAPYYATPGTPNYFNPEFSKPGTLGVGTGKQTGSAFQHQVAWDPSWGKNPWTT